jgi:hypothetical protein
MVVYCRSPFNGLLYGMKISLTEAEFASAYAQWVGGVLIQNAFPTLTPDQREFITWRPIPRPRRRRGLPKCPPESTEE